MEIKIKKGLDLSLKGSVIAPVQPVDISASRVAISPDDFQGFIPKAEVKAGDKVRIGDALFRDKNNDDIKLVSPVSGIVKDIVRGARRHIERIIVEADGNNEYKIFNIPETGKISRSEILTILAQSGLLAMMRCRPYDIVPSTEFLPRDIFVTAFDSAPLAVDMPLDYKSDREYLSRGAEVLASLTNGKVYLSHRAETNFSDIKNVIDVTVKGPHPSGLTGVQAANIAPVSKGETVWTLTAVTMWRIGKLFSTARVDATTYTAVTGSEIDVPYIAKTVIGAEIYPIIKGRLKNDENDCRIISGNVLTGIKIEGDDAFMHYPYTQLTVIPEITHKDEFMGWASLSTKKMSVSRSFPGHFFGREFTPDARMNGGRRAIIMSGEYDKVFPMDILPEYLIKAIKGRDIEAMEKLGIYEVAPEDFALAEYVDSSKQPLQQIVREGLDFLRKELE